MAEASRICSHVIAGSLLCAAIVSAPSALAASPEHELREQIMDALDRSRSILSVDTFLDDVGPRLLAGDGCWMVDPDAARLGLAERAAWSREVAHCASNLAALARTEGARKEHEADRQRDAAAAQAPGSHQYWALLAAAGHAERDAMAFESVSLRMQQASRYAGALGDTRDGEKEFLGLNWGLGFGASYSFDDVIDEATLVGGIVRTKKEKTLLPRAVLEFHVFFVRSDKLVDGTRITRGHGPFAAISATSDDVIAGFGLGYMIGWKDNDKDRPADSSAFTVGLGIMLDAEVRTLAPGIEPDQPLPAGETEIRFEEKSRPSLLLIVTRAF